jgi:hypothetical protein
MTDQAKSIKDGIAEAINKHGIFFKQSVRQKLEGIPNVSIFGEEYPINYLEGGALDLLVQVKAIKCVFVIPTECKRARTTTKQWIFFPDPSNYSKFIYSFKKNKCIAQHAGNFTNIGLTICIEGIEVEKQETRLKNTNFYKADPDPIWDAANQVCKGLSGILIDEIEQRDKNPEATNIPDIFIFPMVITTAQFFLCEADRNAINASSGNYEKELPLREVGWTILSHPYTPSQAFNVKRLGIPQKFYTDFNIRGWHTKEGITFVNINYLDAFISLLDTYPAN